MASTDKLQLITAQELLSAASQETGLSDYGDKTFVEPLTCFLESAQKEGNLGELGLMGLKMDTIRLLSNRLRVQSLVRKYPEVLDEDISDPIIVIGLPRTGTTKLQRMLGRHGSIQSLPYWQAQFPVSFSAENLDDAAQRREIGAQMLEAMKTNAADYWDAHQLELDEPEEEMFLQLMSFEGTTSHGMAYRCPSYLEWLSDRPRQPAYEYLKQVFQVIQWQNRRDGVKKTGPWVLKTPMHLENIDVIAKVFPHAALVHCHRKLDAAIASTVRIVELARKSTCESLDPVELGKSMLDEWARQWENNLERRAALPDSVSVIDVDFSDICDRPLDVAKVILEGRGLSLSDELATEILAWDEASTHSPRKTSTSEALAYYGINSDLIRRRFSKYLNEFPETSF